MHAGTYAGPPDTATNVHFNLQRTISMRDDTSFPDDMKARLEQALTAAGVDHVIETYPARHGFVLRDTPAFDAPAEERHWRTLTQLLAQSFGSAA